MSNWANLATEESIAKATAALTANGVEVITVADGAAAKAKVLELIPAGAEVMNMTSITLETTGIATAINESGRYDSVKAKLAKMDRATQGRQMQQLGAAPEWAIGSVHGVTEEGQIIVASATGSQLPAYAYGAAHVIWVVGTQKIVKDFEAGMERLREYVLPLESERAHKAYGVAGSSINKLLVLNKENPGRLTMIFVKEVLGF